MTRITLLYGSSPELLPCHPDEGRVRAEPEDKQQQVLNSWRNDVHLIGHINLLCLMYRVHELFAV